MKITNVKQRKSVILIIMIFILIVGGICVLFPIKSANAQDSQIPKWVHNIAKGWSDGTISDSEFTKVIQYFIQQGMITISQTKSDTNPSHQIPPWVHNIAKWWSEGAISDSEFTKAILYLVDNRIVQADTSSTTQYNTFHNNGLSFNYPNDWTVDISNYYGAFPSLTVSSPGNSMIVTIGTLENDERLKGLTGQAYLDKRAEISKGACEIFPSICSDFSLIGSKIIPFEGGSAYLIIFEETRPDFEGNKIKFTISHIEIPTSKGTFYITGDGYSSSYESDTKQLTEIISSMKSDVSSSANAGAETGNSLNTIQVIIPSGATNHDCTQSDVCFNPSTMNIKVGSTVVWKNEDNLGHSIASGQPSDEQPGAIFNSDLIKSEGTYSFTFKESGTYPYFDPVYPSMTGKVIVSENTTSSGSSTQQQSYGGYNSWEEYCQAKYGIDYHYDSVKYQCISSGSTTSGGQQSNNAGGSSGTGSSNTENQETQTETQGSSDLTKVGWEADVQYEESVGGFLDRPQSSGWNFLDNLRTHNEASFKVTFPANSYLNDYSEYKTKVSYTMHSSDSGGDNLHVVCKTAPVTIDFKDKEATLIISEDNTAYLSIGQLDDSPVERSSQCAVVKNPQIGPEISDYRSQVSHDRAISSIYIYSHNFKLFDGAVLEGDGYGNHYKIIFHQIGQPTQTQQTPNEGTVLPDYPCSTPYEIRVTPQFLTVDYKRIAAYGIVINWPGCDNDVSMTLSDIDNTIAPQYYIKSAGQKHVYGLYIQTDNITNGTHAFNLYAFGKGESRYATEVPFSTTVPLKLQILNGPTVSPHLGAPGNEPGLPWHTVP